MTASTSGSIRHRPLLESPYHRYRTGFPVIWLIAVPVRMTPEAGDVMLASPWEAKSEVPPHRVVFVGTLMNVCACTAPAANTAKGRTQIHVRVQERSPGRLRIGFDSIVCLSCFILPSLHGRL